MKTREELIEKAKEYQQNYISEIIEPTRSRHFTAVMMADFVLSLSTPIDWDGLKQQNPLWLAPLPQPSGTTDCKTTPIDWDGLEIQLRLLFLSKTKMFTPRTVIELLKQQNKSVTDSNQQNPKFKVDDKTLSNDDITTLKKIGK